MTSFAIYRQNKYKNDPVALNKIEFFYYLLKLRSKEDMTAP